MQTEQLKNRRVQIGLWVPELAAQNFRNPQQSTLILCSPNSSPTSRGVCTIKRRRFNDLGEDVLAKQMLSRLSYTPSQLHDFNRFLGERPPSISAGALPQLGYALVQVDTGSHFVFADQPSIARIPAK
jgi:hypothetical protein